MNKTHLAVLLTCTVLVTPAQAELLGPFFEKRGACYARHYDNAHLASHPRQKVTSIYLSNTAFPDPNYDGVLLDFGFTMRDGEHYSANVYCENDRCGVEGDGGSFVVSETGDGLRIDVGSFLALEGRNGFSGDLAESDDTVFLIFPDSPRACSFD
jgi:hypothetical protein